MKRSNFLLSQFLPKFKEYFWFVCCDSCFVVFRNDSLLALLQFSIALSFLPFLLWAPQPSKEGCRASCSPASADSSPTTTTWWWFSSQPSGPTSPNLAHSNPPPTILHELTLCLTSISVDPTWIKHKKLSQFLSENKISKCLFRLFCLFSRHLLLFLA